jgi:hypothetical protein
VSEWTAKLLEQLAAPGVDREVVLADVLWDRGCIDEMLIEALGSLGVWVNFSTALAPWEQGVAGGFTVQGGVPSITLYREQATRLAGDPLSELITLAHELGHAQSWRLGYRTTVYLDVVDRVYEPGRSFAFDEAVLVLDEELRAWRFARSILGQKGFTKWAAFDEHKTRALAIYCERLNLHADAWKEREAGCENSARGEAPAAQCGACAGLGWIERE